MSKKNQNEVSKENSENHLQIPWKIFSWEDMSKDDRAKVVAIFRAQPERVKEAFQKTVEELIKGIKISTKIEITNVDA